MSRVTLLDYQNSRRTRDAAADAAPLEDCYWRKKTLSEMNEREWESLCDNCGKCCVISLEDADTGELYLTDVSCKLFDSKACGCSDYANRKQYVPDCVKLTPKNVPNSIGCRAPAPIASSPKARISFGGTRSYPAIRKRSTSHTPPCATRPAARAGSRRKA